MLFSDFLKLLAFHVIGGQNNAPPQNGYKNLMKTFLYASSSLLPTLVQPHTPICTHCTLEILSSLEQ